MLRRNIRLTVLIAVRFLHALPRLEFRVSTT
nr:MAG TPA: hypothetical protein [Bacteriophage sp.]